MSAIISVYRVIILPGLIRNQYLINRLSKERRGFGRLSISGFGFRERYGIVRGVEKARSRIADIVTGSVPRENLFFLINFARSSANMIHAKVPILADVRWNGWDRRGFFGKKIQSSNYPARLILRHGSYTTFKNIPKLD